MVFINPIIEIGLIALAFFIFNNLLRHKFTDTESMEKTKEKQKEWKKLMKSNKKEDQKKTEKLQHEIMETQLNATKGMLPQLLIMMAIFIFLVLPLMNAHYNSEVVPPAPYLGIIPGENWIGYYFGFVIVFSIAFAIIKKAWKKYKKSD